MAPKRIGITTTIPVEIIYAAGCIPVDLNNIFITSQEPGKFVDFAEELGYPRAICAWIKGIYGAVAKDKKVDLVIIVTQGDCSNTISMMETFKIKGIETIPFNFPYDRDKKKLRVEIERLAGQLGTTLAEAEEVRRNLSPIRNLLRELDELTYRDYKVFGSENHLWLVSSSDFWGDPEKFKKELSDFIKTAKERKPTPPHIKLGLLGVPPIIPDLYDYLESKSARIIYNEIQREFAMLKPAEDIIDQYLNYTYPYDVFRRIDSIIPDIRMRGLDGVIHYVQSFCHRQIEDIILREKLDTPILTLEGDRPAHLDERLKLRIDSFLDIINSTK